MLTATHYPLTALAIALLLLTLQPAPAAGEKSSGAAFEIDLSTGLPQETAAALPQSLGMLLQTVDNSAAAQPSNRPRLLSLNQVITLLRQHKGVAYVIFARRGEQVPVTLDQIFVVPDVVKLTLSGNPAQETNPTPPAAGEPPSDQEVTVIPGEGDKPPRIKFQFDPEKYVQPGAQ
jgi:hypothetical protein